MRLTAGRMLELHSGVVDAVAIQQEFPNFAQNTIAFRRGYVVDGDVRGERAGLRAQAPDMEIVHIEHTVNGGERGANLRYGKAARCALKQDVEGLAHDGDGAPEDHGGDQQREYGIDPVEVRVENGGT